MWILSVFLMNISGVTQKYDYKGINFYQRQKKSQNRESLYLRKFIHIRYLVRKNFIFTEQIHL